MDWKRELKLRDIRDTLIYFKPCNFTLNTLEDFVLTYCGNKKTNVNATINFSNFVCHKQLGKKSPLNVFIKLFSQQQLGYFYQVKQNARTKFWFSSLLFPKEVLKVVRCKSPVVFKMCK